MLLFTGNGYDSTYIRLLGLGYLLMIDTKRMGRDS